MERVLLKNQKIFFKEILENKNLSLRSLSKKLNINYSTMKQIARGEISLPKNIFDRLLSYTKKAEYWCKKAEIKAQNWGQSKGGKTWSSKLTKKELQKVMKKVRMARRLPKIKIRFNKDFCEFFGALMGDGCLSKYKDAYGNRRCEIVLTGDLRYDNNYHSYLKTLVKKEFGINIYSYGYNSQNLIKSMIKNRALFIELSSLGFPIGKKGKRLKIPNKLLKLSWELKKYIIRGLFDTDGCISAKKNEGYRYPYICITSTSKKLRNQIRKILRSKGYPAYFNNKNIFIKGIENTKRWMQDIGTSNWKHKFKYNYWLNNRKLPAFLLKEHGLVVQSGIVALSNHGQ